MADQFSEALRAAAKEGNLSTIQLLLEQQALVDAVDVVRSTQEHLEELLDRELEHLMADDSFNTALHYASYNGHLQCIELLLDRQANVDAAGITGVTPLYLAADRGHLRCIELLLDGEGGRCCSWFLHRLVLVASCCSLLAWLLGVSLVSCLVSRVSCLV